MDYNMWHSSSPPSWVLYPPAGFDPQLYKKRGAHILALNGHSLHIIQVDRFAKVKACSGLSIMIQKQQYWPALFPLGEFLKGLAVQNSDHLPLNFQYAVVLHLPQCTGKGLWC